LLTLYFYTIKAAALPGAAVWRIRIIESGSANPVPLARWYDPDHTGWAPVTGGRLSISLPNGAYVVEAYAPDASLHRQEVQVTAGEETALHFPASEEE
jgi:hypothetical protein